MMHGVIGMLVNRKGRKRKSGRRESNGRIRKPPMDYRALAAQQPHRNWLPESVRGHERAESALGCLNLLGRISDEMYEAGRRFGVIVGLYRQVIGTPKGNVGSGRGFHCVPEMCAKKPEICSCETKVGWYRDATHVLTLAGQKPYNVTYQTAIHDIMPTTSDQFMHLRSGLYALAQGFGLTNRRRI